MSILFQLSIWREQMIGLDLSERWKFTALLEDPGLLLRILVLSLAILS